MNVIDILKDIVKIKSITKQEDELKNYIINFLKIKNIDFFSIRNNIVVRSEKESIALVGHIDTVDNINEKNGIIEDDKIYGLGVSDMKSGIAIMLSLIQKFHKLPITWIFYDREEGSYNENGLELIFKNIDLKKIKFAIILEPTSNNIEIGCNGAINYELLIKGQSGHSARDYINPFYLAIPIIEKIKNYKREYFEKVLHFDEKEYKISYRSNCTITQIKGMIDIDKENNFRNVVPEYCFLNVNVRYTPDKNFNQVDEYFRRNFFSDTYSIKLADHAPAGKIILNNDLENFISWYLKKGEFKILAKQGWTDVARFSLHNIAAINIGPGEPSQAHQKNEYSYISKIKQLHNILQEFIKQLN
jgi:succinyl-diaminopimelate desuccinylase